MILRKLTEAQAEALRQALPKQAEAEPWAASYTVSLRVNDAVYRVKLQPDRHNRVAVLQALCVRQRQTGPSYELITRGNLLAALLEILLDQDLSGLKA